MDCKHVRQHADAGSVKLGQHGILQGDCRKTLQSIPDNSVHLVVTSPPYNVSIDYGSSSDTLSFNEYLTFTDAWIKECYRVLKVGGRICINIPISTFKNYRTPHLMTYYLLLKRAGFLDRDIIFWVKKRNSDGQFPRRTLYFGKCSAYNPHVQYPCEAIIVMHKQQACLEGQNSDLTMPEFLRWQYNIWEMDTEGNRTHPAPFPEELPMRLIKLYSFPNQVVLDPFLGSGTTMYVADKLNRKCIGCELHQPYINLATKRMRKHKVMVHAA